MGAREDETLWAEARARLGGPGLGEVGRTWFGRGWADLAPDAEAFVALFS